MIRLDDIALQHGRQVLFVGASAVVDRGVTIGHFSQDVGEMKGRTVVAEAMEGAGPVSKIGAELRELEHALADPGQADRMESLLERFGDVQARFEEVGGYGLEARAR